MSFTNPMDSNMRRSNPALLQPQNQPYPQSSSNHLSDNERLSQRLYYLSKQTELLARDLQVKTGSDFDLTVQLLNQVSQEQKVVLDMLNRNSYLDQLKTSGHIADPKFQHNGQSDRLNSNHSGVRNWDDYSAKGYQAENQSGNEIRHEVDSTRWVNAVGGHPKPQMLGYSQTREQHVKYSKVDSEAQARQYHISMPHAQAMKPSEYNNPQSYTNTDPLHSHKDGVIMITSKPQPTIENKQSDKSIDYLVDNFSEILTDKQFNLHNYQVYVDEKGQKQIRFNVNENWQTTQSDIIRQNTNSNPNPRSSGEDARPEYGINLKTDSRRTEPNRNSAKAEVITIRGSEFRQTPYAYNIQDKYGNPVMVLTAIDDEGQPVQIITVAKDSEEIHYVSYINELGQQELKKLADFMREHEEAGDVSLRRTERNTESGHFTGKFDNPDQIPSVRLTDRLVQTKPQEGLHRIFDIDVDRQITVKPLLKVETESRHPTERQGTQYQELRSNNPNSIKNDVQSHDKQVEENKQSGKQPIRQNDVIGQSKVLADRQRATEFQTRSTGIQNERIVNRQTEPQTRSQALNSNNGESGNHVAVNLQINKASNDNKEKQLNTNGNAFRKQSNSDVVYVDDGIVDNHRVSEKRSDTQKVVTITKETVLGSMNNNNMRTEHGSMYNYCGDYGNIDRLSYRSERIDTGIQQQSQRQQDGNLQPTFHKETRQLEQEKIEDNDKIAPIEFKHHLLSDIKHSKVSQPELVYRQSEPNRPNVHIVPQNRLTEYISVNNNGTTNMPNSEDNFYALVRNNGQGLPQEHLKTASTETNKDELVNTSQKNQSVNQRNSEYNNSRNLRAQGNDPQGGVGGNNYSFAFSAVNKLAVDEKSVSKVSGHITKEGHNVDGRESKHQMDDHKSDNKKNEREIESDGKKGEKKDKRNKEDKDHKKEKKDKGDKKNKEVKKDKKVKKEKKENEKEGEKDKESEKDKKNKKDKKNSDEDRGDNKEKMIDKIKKRMSKVSSYLDRLADLDPETFKELEKNYEQSSAMQLLKKVEDKEGESVIVQVDSKSGIIHHHHYHHSNQGSLQNSLGQTGDLSTFKDTKTSFIDAQDMTIVDLKDNHHELRTPTAILNQERERNLNATQSLGTTQTLSTSYRNTGPIFPEVYQNADRLAENNSRGTATDYIIDKGGLYNKDRDYATVNVNGMKVTRKSRDIKPRNVSPNNRVYTLRERVTSRERVVRGLDNGLVKTGSLGGFSNESTYNRFNNTTVQTSSTYQQREPNQHSLIRSMVAPHMLLSQTENQAHKSEY